MSSQSLAPAERRAITPAVQMVLPGPLAAFLLCFSAITPIMDWNQNVWWICWLLIALWVVRGAKLTRSIWLPLSLLGLAAWMFLSLLWSVNPAKSLQELSFQFAFILMGMLASVGRDHWDLLKLFVRTGVWFIGFNMLFAFFLPANGQGGEGSNSTDYKGLFPDKNHFGFFCTTVAVSAVVRAINAERPGQRLACWLGAGIGVLGVWLSGSATALLMTMAWSLLIVLGVGLVRSRRPHKLAATGVMLLAGSAIGLMAMNSDQVLAVLGRSSNLTGRTEIWVAVQRAIAERPFTGFGWHALWLDEDPTSIRFWSYNYGDPFYHAHNGFLELAVELGLVGAVLGWGFIVLLLVRSLRELRVDPRGRLWPVVLIPLVLAYNLVEVMGFSDATFIVLVALACKAPALRKEGTCTSVMHGK